MVIQEQIARKRDLAAARLDRPGLQGVSKPVADALRRITHLGIGTIMEARQNLLLAFGSKTARAIADAVEGPIMAVNPAAVLRLPPASSMCLDEDAAAPLQRADYYRWVYGNKPGWQHI